MKNTTNFLFTTLTGGFIVVLPVVLLFLTLAETFDMIVVVAQPIADLVPIPGLDAATERALLAVLLLIAICFLTGLALRTGLGVRIGRWVDARILQRIPGYGFLKAVSRRFAGDESDSRFTPAVVTTALDTRMLAFVIEEHENGDVVIFVPTAPSTFMGMIHIVPKEQVRKLDVPIAEMTNCFLEFGTGTGKLLAGIPGSPRRES